MNIIDTRLAIVESLKHRDGNKCALCGECFLPFAPPHIDHVKPRSKGGTHSWYNLQVVHGHCNSRKGTREIDSISLAGEQEARLMFEQLRIRRNYQNNGVSPLREKAKQLLAEGKNVIEIAQEIGVSTRTAYRYLEKE